jgi:CheY-like chemotaxis protein
LGQLRAVIIGSDAEKLPLNSKVPADLCRKMFMQTYASQVLERNTVSSFVEPRSSRFVTPYDDLQSPSVLIADDDPNIAPLVSAALKPYHIYTEAVTGGAAALARLRQRTYHLVVLDLGMADVHGLEVLRTLREQSRLARVPVLILTANTSHQALAQSFGSGADEFLKKPFDINELGVRAFRLIRGSRQS